MPQAHHSLGAHPRSGCCLTLYSPLTPLLTPQYNYGFVVEKTAAARLPPSVS